MRSGALLVVANLQQAFQFEANDLAANRKGYLTIAQQKRIVQSASNHRLLLLIGGALLGAALLSALVLNTIGLPLSLLLVLVGLGTIFSGQVDTRELAPTDLRVAKVTGEVQLMTLTTPTLDYIVRVGVHSFKVTEEQFRAFVPEQTYILYYLPSDHLLLSAELASTFADATSKTRPIRGGVYNF